MQIQSMHFKARAGAKLADQVLQQNLKTFKGKFVGARAAAVADFNTIGDWEAVRSAGAAIRQRTLQQLDVWIERFEAEATRRGATVLFAEDGAEAAQLLLQICQQHGVKKLVKSKSMVSEEASLNQVLSEAGVTPVETDLGEYILQIKGNESPSHIIAPALHLNKDEVADLFERVHGTPRKTVIEDMTREAREQLRGHFLSADMGVSGGNFLVAETGSVAIVTNEGNGRMVTTLPPVHVAITGIEKVVPTLEDLSTLLRLLPRSATGQAISNYVSLLTGRRGAQDQDGPQHMYFILVDNGRTGLLGGDMQPMLQCIRCGACMNHCPVYQTVGGHAYGWVYPGPMGSVLTPAFQGLEQALDLPHAATLCGACSVACPVQIPLPDLLRRLRQQQTEAGLRPWRERLALRAWAWLALRPRLYAAITGLALRALRTLRDRHQMIGHLPLVPGWRGGGPNHLARSMPAPRSAQRFLSRYQQLQHGQSRSSQ